MPPAEQIRLLVVEDVPQVAQYIRNLLATQQQIRLLDVVADGGKALPAVAELRPDVVIVDALLQGRVKGTQLAEQIAAQAPATAVIMLTVPQTPVAIDPARGIHGVVTMPFSGFDLVSRIVDLHRETTRRHLAETSTVISVFSPKGGTGKTTIAFNLAVALGQLGQRTVLIDGSLQFGDLRTLLKVPATAPSILDLPTDRVAESDLHDVLWRDPSGIDILLAPPRIEMAEMITVGDIDKAMAMLRRIYRAVVIDTHAGLDAHTMSFLDLSDTIVEVLTFDSTTLHNVVAMGEVFRAIGYPAAKVRYLVNRADSAGGIRPDDVVKALGRVPEHRVISDGPLVLRANNEGVPFVIADPGAQISQDVSRAAQELLAATAPLKVPVGAGR